MRRLRKDVDVRVRGADEAEDAEEDVVALPGDALGALQDGDPAAEDEAADRDREEERVPADQEQRAVQRPRRLHHEAAQDRRDRPSPRDRPGEKAEAGADEQERVRPHCRLEAEVAPHGGR
jgi:hypothetical protein